MSEIRWRPWAIQKEVLKARHDYRYRLMFAGKRGSKSEVAYVDTCLKIEEKPNYISNGVDPYLIVIIAPTHQMLQKLVWPKFIKFAAPWIKEFVPSANKIVCNDGETIIYGISAEKISRMEGLKVHHIHITEVFQVKEEVFLESLARTTDTKGSITIDGSLGPQLINPKNHWVYKHFKEKHFPNSKIWEWATIENPYIDKEEILKMREALDLKTFRSMYEIDWDTPPLHAVYDNFSEKNIIDSYSPLNKLETIISIDWGFAHPMAVVFLQYDRARDIFYQFDEIIKSKLTLDKLYQLIKQKIEQHNLQNVKWVCDVAGNQEREQLGISNVRWFWENHQIRIQSSRLKVLKTVAIIRSYIQNSNEVVRFFISKNCELTIDGLKRYRYVVKDGVVQNENPEKIDDDGVDALRYGILNGAKTISGIEIS
jgi:phage terminase large subunit